MEQSTSSSFPRDVCEQVTPDAFLRRNPRPWTNAWFDHVQQTHDIFDETHNQRTWQESRVSSLGQIQKINLETRHLSISPPELPRFPSLHCCSQGYTTTWCATSDDDETAGEVNTTCAEEAEASGHDFAQCAFLAPISLAVRLLAVVALAAGLGIQTFVWESALVSTSASARGKVFTGDRRAVRTFVITFGTLSRSNRAVAETSVCVHHCPAAGFANNGRVQLSWIA